MFPILFEIGFIPISIHGLFYLFILLASILIIIWEHILKPGDIALLLFNLLFWVIFIGVFYFLNIGLLAILSILPIPQNQVAAIFIIVIYWIVSFIPLVIPASFFLLGLANR